MFAGSKPSSVGSRRHAPRRLGSSKRPHCSVLSPKPLSHPFPATRGLSPNKRLFNCLEESWSKAHRTGGGSRGSLSCKQRACVPVQYTSWVSVTGSLAPAKVTRTPPTGAAAGPPSPGRSSPPRSSHAGGTGGQGCWTAGKWWQLDPHISLRPSPFRSQS